MILENNQNFNRRRRAARKQRLAQYRRAVRAHLRRDELSLSEICEATGATEYDVRLLAKEIDIDTQARGGRVIANKKRVLTQQHVAGATRDLKADVLTAKDIARQYGMTDRWLRALAEELGIDLAERAFRLRSRTRAPIGSQQASWFRSESLSKDGLSLAWLSKPLIPNRKAA